MTAEQSLVGAMGCASWRAHHRLREYAELAPAGGIIRGGPISQPSTQHVEALGLNEVGVTDSVMATLWRFGPNAAAFAVSPGAESNHLGADIAIVHSGTRRVLLYQAKLAWFDGETFRLKSDAPAAQVSMLARNSVVLDGVDFAVTGRLAAYQADVTPFLGRGEPFFWFDEWERLLRRGPLRRDFARRPDVGRRYYEEVLLDGCSPSGVLAAPVSGDSIVSTVEPSKCWPWEFDTYEWLRGSSPLDASDVGDGEAAAPAPNLTERVPNFEPYVPAAREQPGVDSQRTALQLATQLNLPVGRLLNVIQL
jgi:hypothetical protein